MFFATGTLDRLDNSARRILMSRAGDRDVRVRDTTASIIDDVRARGDAAIRDMAARFDGATLSNLEVPREDRQRALNGLDKELRQSLERAARNIERVHSAFRPVATEVSPEPGIVVGRRPDALNRVGVYAPGGRAAYPSSLLMGAIPAKVAGVAEVIVCSPPSANGKVSDVVLAAAELAGADRVFAIGGAGAIAAMAIGTDSVPRVDRIVGPGNAYVAEAKLQLTREVAIDSPAGPSELLVLADSSANADVIANEVMAQAEHDPEAAVIVLIAGTNAADVSAQIANTLAAKLATAPRAEIIRASLSSRGALLVTTTLDAAVAFANEWAAEHLLLAVRSELMGDTLARLRSAGTVFLGESSSVAFGDYMTGANHVLPTAGLARCYSGLSTLDFVRWTSWQSVTPQAARSLAPQVVVFAESEGLPAHANAARYWLPDVGSPSPLA